MDTRDLLKAAVFGLAVCLLAGTPARAAEPYFIENKTYVARGNVQLYYVRCIYNACGKKFDWAKDIASWDLEPKRRECRENYVRDAGACRGITVPIPPSVPRPKLEAIGSLRPICQTNKCVGCPTAPPEGYSECSLDQGANRKPGAPCTCVVPPGVRLGGTVVIKKK